MIVTQWETNILKLFNEKSLYFLIIAFIEQGEPLGFRQRIQTCMFFSTGMGCQGTECHSCKRHQGA